MTTATEIEYHRPTLYPLQEAAFFCPERYSITEASTKSGKTVGAMAWQIEQVLASKTGQNHWWTAPILAQAKIAYRRVKAGLPPSMYKSNDSDVTLTFLNGAVWWFKGSDNPDSLYGEDVYSAVVEEYTRMKEAAWWAIRTTLTATQGPVRLIGNVRGRKNWGYKMARRAEANMTLPVAERESMAYHKITWRDAVAAGVLEEKEVRAAERDLPTAVFRELYEAEASDDAGNPFGFDAIANCVAPLSTESPKVWGWDLAKSVDYTVGIALDSKAHVSRFHRFQASWGDTQERMRQETQVLPALVDATGVGDPVVEALQRDGMYRFEGFKFSGPSKQELMFQLRTAIQKADVHFPDGPIRLELEAFEYEYTQNGVRYSAPEGSNDDCVMGLALAYRQYVEKRIGPATDTGKTVATGVGYKV